MKNETVTSLQNNNDNADGLYVNIHSKRSLKNPSNKMVEEIEEPEANKLNAKLNQQISKLIKMYSTEGKTSGLTREQFKVLANDLYSSVDRQRNLTEEELQNLVNLLDADKNDQISREQIMTLIQDQKPSTAHSQLS